MLDWKLVIMCASFSILAASLIKYGFLWLLERQQRTIIHEAILQVMKEHLKDDIINRIDYVTLQTVTKIMYGHRFEVRDEEGKIIGKIGRTDSF